MTNIHMTKLKDVPADELKGYLRGISLASNILSGAHTIRGNLADYPMNAVIKILEYGFQRIHNDGLGGKDVPAEEKVARAEKKADALRNGIIRQVASGKSAHDRFVDKFIMDKIKEAFRAAGKTVKDFTSLPAATRQAAIDKAKEAQPEWMDAAEKAWKARNDAPAATVDLAALGLAD